MIRVAVVVPAPLVRADLLRLLQEGERVEPVAAAESLAALQATLAADGQPGIDVVLVSWQGAGPDEDGDAERLRALLDAGARVVLLDDAEPASRAPLLAAGAAWLPGDARNDEIVAAIEAAAAGLVALRPGTAADLLLRPRPGERRAIERVEALTPRELQVLRLLADGFGNKRVARDLGISEHTAKFHVGRILGKLAAATRAEAVKIGLRDGLIDPDGA
jgi:DNA-binding NarL/FixJ family response regulator